MCLLSNISSNDPSLQLCFDDRRPKGRNHSGNRRKHYIYISCLHLSKSYIKVSKKETETSFSDLNLSQDPLYLKLLALTFSHCLKNLKFEETFEVIKKKNEFLGFFYKFNKFNMNK